MKVVPLGHVSEINPRKPQDLSLDAECSFVPMEYVDDCLGVIANTSTRRIKEVQKGYTYFRDWDVLFAKITPCMENGKCAIARNLVNGIGFGSTEFHVVRPKHDVIPEWIFYFLRQQSTRNEAARHMTGTAGQQRVPTRFLEEVEIPLPPLPDQQRIAAVLARTDRLRRLRRYALDLGDGYLQSVFLEMFYTNASPDWPRVTIASLAKKGKNTIRTGPFGSQLLHSEFVDEGIAVLGIDNAVQNRFVWARPRFITREKYQQLKRYTVFPGDVIITIMGTTGRCAIIPDDIPLAINTKHLCCITLDQSKCLPTYLRAGFLNHPSVLHQLGVSERGAVMPGLNMQLIKDLVVPLPPLALQQQFAHIVYKVERLRAQQREAQRQAEHLFQTLLHRAFQGELAKT